MARFLKRRLTLILLAFACGAVLVACVLRGDLSPAWLGPSLLILLALRYAYRGRAASLFADGLLTVFGLALACLPTRVGPAVVSEPSSSPSFFIQLDHGSLERLAHRYLPPPPGDEIRYQVCLRQSREGWLQEMPGDLYVLPCQPRAQWLSLSGAALFTLGLSLLIANLGSQHRARTQISRWERPL